MYFFFFQAEDGIRDLVRSRGLGDVYKRQGHVDLSNKTGAPIIYGPNASCEFDCVSALDNQIFELGNVKIKVLHTPGHTLSLIHI